MGIKQSFLKKNPSYMHSQNSYFALAEEYNGQVS